MKSQKSHKPEVFLIMTQTLILTHFPMGMKGRMEVMTLSFSLEMEDVSLEKTMGTLTLKGLFIGFPTRLK